MKVAFLLRNFLPGSCGVSDYCVEFAKDFCFCGHHASIVEYVSDHKHFKVFESSGLELAPAQIINDFSFFNDFDFVFVQYTPFMYSDGWFDGRFVSTKLAKNISVWTRVICVLHEGFDFRVSRPLSSLLAGIQLAEIVSLANFSELVFTSSQVLISSLKTLVPKNKLAWLPISSNVPVVGPAISEDINLNSHRLKAQNIVCIFGGGNNLRRAFHHVTGLETFLAEYGIDFRWLVLGSIDADLLRKMNNPIVPGHLSAVNLSRALAQSRVFFMPNADGVSLKRGTLMAAMEHSLPVVGTIGKMSDPILRDCEGIRLHDLDGGLDLYRDIMSLLLDSSLHYKLAQCNREDYEKLFSRRVRYNMVFNCLKELS